MNESVAAIIAELAKRRPVLVGGRNAAADAASRIRDFYHPKQGAFYRPGPAKLRATKKTRRAGATSGGCREFVARAIEQPGFRATYVTSTRKEARERAWQNDTKSGLVDVLRHYGVLVEHPSLEVQVVGGVRCDVRDQAMIIDFDNGSRIDLFGADDMRALRKQRGLAKHVYWIDEAQDFRYIEMFYDAVVIGSLTDYEGECWLTGTPGRDTSGMFYDVTKDDEDDGPRTPGWEVHTIAVVDNPYFGHVVGDTSADGRLCYHVEDNMRGRTGPHPTFASAEAAAIQVRWDRTAGAAMKSKGWKGDEPDFVREWLGKWTRVDARYVYPVHTVPMHTLLYAPQRPAPNPFVGTHPRYDGHPPWINVQKAISDLPRDTRRNNRIRQWMFAIGLDFGYHPDPFAIVVWAFCHDLPDVYELFSWKCTRVHTDDQGLYIKLIWDSLTSVVVLVGDPAGKQDDFDVWRTRMNLPIDEANKKGKNTLEEFLADDVRRGRVRLRIDSPLHTEMKHLVYLPTKPGKTREVAKHRKSSDGKVHGDHCCFVAGTMVETASGPRSIEKLELYERVITRRGLREIEHLYAERVAPTWRVDLSNGQTITGTADHPFLVQDAWKSLSDLMPGDMLTTCQDPKSSCLADTDIADTLTPKFGRSACTIGVLEKSPGSASSNISIERSGNTRSDRFPTDTTSIIATRTHSTTARLTSSASSGQNISASMPESRSVSHNPEPVWRSRARSLLSGTGLLRAWSGIGSTVGKLLLPDSLSRWFASIATTTTPARTLQPSSAATRARPPLVEIPASTMSTSPVPSVAWSSERTDTRNPVAAPIRVLRVEPTGRNETVYNFSVQEAHEYFVEGVLVSNCDAGRYAFADLTHYLSRAVADKPKAGSKEALEAEAEKIEKRLDYDETRRAERMMEGDEEMLSSLGIHV